MKHVKSLMEKVRRGQGGFTLIELLIVLAILGTIAAVVILNVGGFRGTGAKQAALIEKDAVQTAVLAAMIDGGCTQIEETTIDPTTQTACTLPLIPTYMQGVIVGTWTLDASGQITAGTYTSGGKTCTWNGTAGTMICADA